MAKRDFGFPNTGRAGADKDAYPASTVLASSDIDSRDEVVLQQCSVRQPVVPAIVPLQFATKARLVESINGSQKSVQSGLAQKPSAQPALT
jgi:hypothetical protein